MIWEMMLAGERGAGACRVERLEPTRLQPMLVGQPPPCLRGGGRVIAPLCSDIDETVDRTRRDAATFVADALGEESGDGGVGGHH